MFMNPVNSHSPHLLSPPANLRDLGGIRVSGGTVRTGFAWRADDLSLVDVTSARQLVNDGLTTVIDLRSLAEAGNTGRGALADHPVAYHHVPFWTTFSEDLAAGSGWDQSKFHQLYLNLYENAAGQIVSAFEIIAAAPGAVAFHCSAGQDRTGVLAAALLLTLGATREDIITDYALTGKNSVAIRERTAPVLAPILAELGVNLDPAARAALRTEFSSAPMTALLAHLATTYRDPLQPLYRAGLEPALVEKLRESGITDD